MYHNGHRCFNWGGYSNWRRRSAKAPAILSKRRARVSWTLYEMHSIGILYYGWEARKRVEVQVVYVKGMDAYFRAATILV